MGIIEGAIPRGAGVERGSGASFFVSPSGAVGNNGGSWSNAYLTIQAAVTAAGAGDYIFIGAGEYDEQVTVARAKSNLTIECPDGRGAAYIAPSAANPTALTNEADDLTLVNIGLEGDGSGGGLVNRGARLRAKGCKIEGGANAVKLTLGTDAQITAATHGKGADVLFEDCEICWSTNGVQLIATDYGAVTQARFRNCTFHDNSAAAFEESGGSAAVRYRDIEIKGCTFLRLEDGTEPTAYVLLNDDNANSGIVAGCLFPSALNGGKNLVSTAMLWVGNLHPAGLSTGQPS